MPDKAATIAEGLRSQIETCADEIDETRKLPDGLVATLKRAGAFRLLVPKSLGGLETPLPEFLDAVQIYARRRPRGRDKRFRQAHPRPSLRPQVFARDLTPP